MANVDRAFLLTAHGAAAIAVVRIVGNGVGGFLSRCFSCKPRLGAAVHGELRDGERVLDDPVVALLQSDVAELNLHGGPWVVRSVLELLQRQGFGIIDHPTLPLASEVVDPEWIGVDSFDSDELESYRSTEWLERQVLRSLPLARTEQGVRLLLAQPAAWQKFWADGPSSDDVARVCADRLLDRLLYPARVAIVGAANVGKSTLANRLFGQAHSITADLPGTTRDWVGELAELKGVPVFLIDTPGLRVTTDPIEAAAIAAAGPQISSAEVVVVVLDASRPMDDEQSAPISVYSDALIAVNKVDRPAAWGRSTLEPRLTQPVVATNGEGVDQLVIAILKRLGSGDSDKLRPCRWTDRSTALRSRFTTTEDDGNLLG